MKYSVSSKYNMEIITVRLQKNEQPVENEILWIRSQRIPGMVPVEVEERGSLFNYNVTGFISMKKYARNRITGADFALLLESIIQSFVVLQKSGMTYTKLLLEDKAIYINPVTKKAVFVYVPIAGYDNGMYLEAFLLYLIKYFKFDRNEDTQFLQELSSMCNSPNGITWEELKEYIQKLKQQEAMKYRPPHDRVDSKKQKVQPGTKPLQDDGGVNIPPQPAGVRQFIFCGKCGAKNSINARFCVKCGKPIVTSVQPAPPQTPPQGKPPVQPVWPTPPQGEPPVPPTPPQGEPPVQPTPPQGEPPVPPVQPVRATPPQGTPPVPPTPPVMTPPMWDPSVQQTQPSELYDPPTEVLIDEDDMPTTYLGPGQPDVIYPYIIRQSTQEKIQADKDIYVIGKGKNIDYAIKGNNAISRSHITLITRDNHYYIKDNNSTNGTCIEGNRLNPEQEYEVFPGTKIRMANEDFILGADTN